MVDPTVFQLKSTDIKYPFDSSTKNCSTMKTDYDQWTMVNEMVTNVLIDLDDELA